jgi:spore germination protein YaaH
MNKKTFLKISLVVLLVILIASQSYLFFQIYNTPQVNLKIIEKRQDIKISNRTELELEVDEIRKVAKSPISIDDLYITGWIPDWDIPDGLVTVKNNSGLFDSISPVWFLVNSDGSLKKTSYTNGPALISHIQENNIELIPTISLFDREIFSSVLNNTENYNRHITQILDNVDKFEYDGIDLDYEEVFLKDKTLFFRLLEDLSKEMKSRNKKLVFSPLAKWADNIEYVGTKMVFDYKRISDYVDEIRIQGYGFTIANDSQIAPIGPINWLEDVLRYSIKIGVPREKIVLGIHTYAYDWSERPMATSIDYYNENRSIQLPIEGLPPADAYYGKALDGVISKYNLQYDFNEEWAEAVGTYMYEGKPRTVIFPTAESIALRKKLAADYGIKGIAYWRVGDEGTLQL